jgi:hypothetical protein
MKRRIFSATFDQHSMSFSSPPSRFAGSGIQHERELHMSASALSRTTPAAFALTMNFALNAAAQGMR